MKNIALLLALMLLVPGAVAAAEFHGYPCTKDCSGHKAGYDWAKKKNITDPADCHGRSQSFVEGCRAFTQNFEDTPYQPPEDDAKPETKQD